jgi:hypothetical protein
VYTSLLLEETKVATVSHATVELFPEAGGACLVLTEAGAYLDGREQPAWREQGTNEWLDALGPLSRTGAGVSTSVVPIDNGRWVLPAKPAHQGPGEFDGG